MKTLLEYRYVLPLALFLGLAPFPQPHVVEKFRMLMSGTLSRPIDIFDLFLHALPLVLLGYRVTADITSRMQKQNSNQRERG